MNRPEGSSTIPEGTVTFLFTDIEGSTKLWEGHPAQMRVALARHDSLLRLAIDCAGGVVFKTVGDAFCAAFSTAPGAVEAALAAQLALLAEPWPEQTPLKVRMALHTGTVERRDDDYFGPPLNRVARLLAIGHGGQSLLSTAVQELVRDNLPTETALYDLGLHQLKDLARPEQVYQLQHTDLPSVFPPLRSLSTHPNNLPQQLTTFIGRETEITAVQSLLHSHKLVTLTGSGGTGKTRLSLQVAASTLETYTDGVWLVELDALTDPGLVPQTMALALGLKEEPGRPLIQSLVEFLKSKHLLLLLDNCEHLLDACAPLVEAVLRQCPLVRILASSREALNISGESTYRVPSLSLPDVTKSSTPESLAPYEAVRLFIDRAVQAQTTFVVTNANAPAVASICHRLDGIPLALELAAARMRSLSVEMVNSKLDQRFRLLTGGSRTALPRQQTLRSLIDWSYDLLSGTEKTLLCCLSVFAGGWTLESAEAVCAVENLDESGEWEVLDLLTSLCDKSLVVAEPSGTGTRYRLLETIRQYAHDRLLESGKEDEFRDRHLSHFLILAEDTEPKLKGPEQVIWLDRLDQEHDNFRAALEWSSTSKSPQEVESCLRLVGTLCWFWLVRGYLSEGREQATRALSLDQSLGTRENALLRAKTLNGAGNLAWGQGDFASARTLHEESLAIRRENGDRQGIANSLNNLGAVAGTRVIMRHPGCSTRKAC